MEYASKEEVAKIRSALTGTEPFSAEPAPTATSFPKRPAGPPRNMEPAERLDTLYEMTGKRQASIPKLQEFVEEWVFSMGGARGLAHKLTQEYQSSKPGTMTRARLLSSLVMVMQMVHRENLDSGDGDYVNMTDTDLRNALNSTLLECEDVRKALGLPTRPQLTEENAQENQGENLDD